MRFICSAFLPSPKPAVATALICLQPMHVYTLSLFSRVRLFATPWTVAHQAPPSMGFSRQEYWSGLPCPPPGHLSYRRIELTSPALQADSLLSEPPGKPQNTGVGSLSLLQGMDLPDSGIKPGLLHYRWILYQLSYQGSPKIAQSHTINNGARILNPDSLAWKSWLNH